MKFVLFLSLLISCVYAQDYGYGYGYGYNPVATSGYGYGSNVNNNIYNNNAMLQYSPLALQYHQQAILASTAHPIIGALPNYATNTYTTPTAPIMYGGKNTAPIVQPLLQTNIATPILQAMPQATLLANNPVITTAVGLHPSAAAVAPIPKAQASAFLQPATRVVSPTTPAGYVAVPLYTTGQQTDEDIRNVGNRPTPPLPLNGNTNNNGAEEQQ